VAAMLKNNVVTIEELAVQIGLSDRAIKKNIAQLKIAGEIRRIGPDKGGRWEVVE
jgi:ATP-dependent DNA helicase RecG